MCPNCGSSNVRKTDRGDGTEDCYCRSCGHAWIAKR